MMRRVVAVLGARALVAAPLMTAASIASAEVSGAEWAAMMDRDIIVEQQDGSHLEGKLIGLDEATIRVMQADGRTVSVDQAAIRSARLRDDGAPPPAAPGAPASTPALPSAPPVFDGLLGRQVVVVVEEDKEITGKLVELSDTSVVIEQDDGERVPLDRPSIRAARRRFSPPVRQAIPDAPAASSGFKAPPFTFGMSTFAGSALTTKSKPMPALGLSARGVLWTYAYVEAGVALTGASDAGGFAEAACVVGIDGRPTDECKTLSSTLGGPTTSAEAGLIYRFTGGPSMDGEAVLGAVLAGVGHRGLHLSRSISNCSDCRTENPHLDGGVYLTPAIEIASVARKRPAYGFQVAYEYFLGGHLSHALWGSLFMEAW